MKLTMVGTGYVGLVTGVCFANTGNDVTCLDIDPEKVERLRRGECPIYEPGLTELLAKNIKSGRLRFSTDAASAHRDAEMIFICVGTPSDDRGHTDLRFIHGAADAIADVLKSLGPAQAPKTIVVKSTVPVGTTNDVGQRIRQRVGPGIPFFMGNNPEFLKEGDAIRDFQYPDRVVCGVENELSRRQFEVIYEPFLRTGKPLICVDIRSSEMVKYAANNFLATKISFINEMANLCEAYGADIDAVRRGMCSDRRIGDQFLHPGLGYGGSCFPKDTQACIMMGEKSGTRASLSQSVHEVNQRQRDLFFNKILKHAERRGGLKGKRLAFWGLAFKPRTDDIRESPALTLVRKALGYGVECRGYDPVAAENAAQEIGPALTICDDMYAACEGADGIVVSTDWDDFKTPDFARLKGLLRDPVIFDGRNLYRPERMRELGFAHHSVGRASVV
jgi:UDPglucose 6-dehydrogenase